MAADVRKRNPLKGDTAIWKIRTPRVYRYLPRQFVEAFFAAGALRVSSFRQFSEHSDEQRLDSKEGKVFLVHRTAANGGQTVVMEVDYGHDAYVLSGSMTPSKQLLADFKCDSAIVISDTTSFAREIAKQIPDFKAGLEGPCSYQYRRIIEKDLGWLDFGTQEETSDLSKMDAEVVTRMYSELNTADAYFLKREVHRHQGEYRFIWLTYGPVKPVIDIVVPDARRYCVPWEGQGDVLAY